MATTSEEEELAMAVEVFCKSYESPYFGPGNVYRIEGAAEVWIRMMKPDGTIIRVIIDTIEKKFRKQYPYGQGAPSPEFEADIHQLQEQMSIAYIDATTG